MLTHLCHIDVTCWLFVAGVSAAHTQKWEAHFCCCSKASWQFHHSVLMCHCTSIKEISYASHYLHQNLTWVRNIMQYMLCSGACLLFDLANTWEAFYKLIIPHCIHNVLKEIIKMPTQRNKCNVLTSSLKMRVWKTLGAVGTWKLQRRAAS